MRRVDSQLCIEDLKSKLRGEADQASSACKQLRGTSIMEDPDSADSYFATSSTVQSSPMATTATTACAPPATRPSPGTPTAWRGASPRSSDLTTRRADRSWQRGNVNHAPTSDCSAAHGVTLTFGYGGLQMPAKSLQDLTAIHRKKFAKKGVDSGDTTGAESRPATDQSKSGVGPPTSGASSPTRLQRQGDLCLRPRAARHRSTLDLTTGQADIVPGISPPADTTFCGHNFSIVGRPDRSPQLGNVNHAPTSDCSAAHGALLMFGYDGRHATSDIKAAHTAPRTSPSPARGGKGGEGKIENLQHVTRRPDGQPVPRRSSRLHPGREPVPARPPHTLPSYS